jgi:hypothetical protein
VESKLADIARRNLADHLRRMTPEQRLTAFLEHNQLVAQLQRAGGATVVGPQIRPRRRED